MPSLNDMINRRLRQIAGRETKHAALYRAVLEAVDSGVVKPGDRLPTEAEWVSQLPVSLGTVQRAIRALVREGHVVRRRGLGTHVAMRPDILENPLHCRFLGPDGFLPVYSALIGRCTEQEAGPWSHLLQQCGDNIQRIDRDLSIDHQFHVLSRIWVNVQKHPSLANACSEDLARRNIKSWLTTQHGVTITRIEQALQTVPFEGLAQKVTRLHGQSWGNRIDLTAIQSDGVAVLFQQIFIPPNPYRLMLSDHQFLDRPWDITRVKELPRKTVTGN